MLMMISHEGQLDTRQYDVELHALTHSSQVEGSNEEDDADGDAADAGMRRGAQEALDEVATNGFDAVAADVTPDHDGESDHESDKWMPKALWM